MTGMLAHFVSVNSVVKYIGKMCKYPFIIRISCLDKFHVPECSSEEWRQSRLSSNVFVVIISEQIRRHLHQAVRLLTWLEWLKVSPVGFGVDSLPELRHAALCVLIHMNKSPDIPGGFSVLKPCSSVNASWRSRVAFKVTQMCTGFDFELCRNICRGKIRKLLRMT